MTSVRGILLGLGVSLLLSGCTDTLAVSDAPTEFDVAVHEAAAPPLETYATSFWAVQGQRTIFRIRYLPPSEPEQDTLPPFLTLTISQKAQMLGSDGAPIARGDSINIGVTVNPELFMVEFAPHGLVFAADDPMELKFWYTFMDETTKDGLKRDPSSLRVLYRARPGDPWMPIESEVSLQGHFIVTDVYHFSGYAVAW